MGQWRRNYITKALWASSFPIKFLLCSDQVTGEASEVIWNHSCISLAVYFRWLHHEVVHTIRCTWYYKMFLQSLAILHNRAIWWFHKDSTWSITDLTAGNTLKVFSGVLQLSSNGKNVKDNHSGLLSNYPFSKPACVQGQRGQTQGNTALFSYCSGSRLRYP